MIVTVSTPAYGEPMRSDPNVAYPVEEFLDDVRALRAPPTAGGANRAQRRASGRTSATTGDSTEQERQHFASKYGRSAGDARRARFAFVTDLTREFDAELRTAGLVTVDSRGVGTSKSWLAFALDLLIPVDNQTPLARDAIAKSVRAWLNHYATEKQRREAAIPVARDPMPGASMQVRALLDQMRVPDPRSFRFLADAEFPGLDPGLRSLLDFMSCRLDDAGDPATRGFWALLLRDVLREARSGLRDPFLGRTMEARLSALVPGEPAPSPFTPAEAHALYFAMDSLSSAARSPSPIEARVRSVITERLLQRRRR